MGFDPLTASTLRGPQSVGALEAGTSPMGLEAPTATLKLKLKSTSGYTEESTYQGVTVSQWSRVCRALNNQPLTAAEFLELIPKRRLLERLLTALKEFDAGANRHGMHWQRPFIAELEESITRAEREGSPQLQGAMPASGAAVDAEARPEGDSASNGPDQQEKVLAKLGTIKDGGGRE